jgi:hypothetical protein
MLIPIAFTVLVNALMQNKAAKSKASFFIVVSSVFGLDGFEPALFNQA